MSRTRLCVLTALGLAGLAAATMAARRAALGPGGADARGPDTWVVSLRLVGKSNGDARLVTLGPIDTPRQRVVGEECSADGFVARRQAAAGRRSVTWTQRPDAPAGPVSLQVDYTVTVAAAPPPPPAGEAPDAGDHLRPEPGIEADAPEVEALARQLADGLDRPADVAEVLYKFVERDVAGEPSVAPAPAGALACLRAAAGDAAAKARLLVALLRNRGIPARCVTGLTLANDEEPSAHTWVEAWPRDRWLPMCAYYHHYGQVPRTFLAFGTGDVRMARGRNVRNLGCTFRAARLPADAASAGRTLLGRVFAQFSPQYLPPAERHAVEFLLLVPVAALVVCVARNVVGLPSFGTFAPALIGLAFRDAPDALGAVVFAGATLAGWLLRRTLDRFHLLQVPRTAVLLSLVVALLAGAVAVAHSWRVPVTGAVSLFPVVILTGLIERFWTLDEEGGAGQSFRVLLSTLGIAAAVAVAAGVPWLGPTMVRYPEALGLVVAAQLLLGRYTGFRLSELIRFRDVAREPPPDVLAARHALRFRRF